MAAARVVIVDARGQTITLTPNAAGNFFTAVAVTFPFRAKVTYQGRERIMVAAQSNGSCNACHTQNGASGAPGRITLP
jgi:mono/diheme cytochrome c family protein